MGAIVSADPAPMAVKPFTPAWLDRLVRRCLQKDPEDRYQSMRDLVIDLKSPPEESNPAPRTSAWSWAAAACLLLALVAVSLIHFRETPPEPPALTLSINPPGKGVFHQTAISPDGKILAFTANVDGQQQLWVRPLHASTAEPLAGTGQAQDPFWSPDGLWIAFFADGKLKKIKAAGGPVYTLCDATNPRGGTWSADGVVLFSELGKGLSRVPAQGGVPTPHAAPDQSKDEAVYRWPVFVAGGSRYLFGVTSSGEDTQGIYLGSLDTNERVLLVGGSESPGYAEGPDGKPYLLFRREGTLLAQPFDVEEGKLAGDAFAVAEGVGLDRNLRSRFSVSGNGTLVVEGPQSGAAQMTWMDRAGNKLPWPGEPATGGSLSLSPDGQRVAFFSRGDIWLLDLARNLPARSTFHTGLDRDPVWSPDGDRIVFSSGRAGILALFVKSAAGTGQAQLLLKTANLLWATDWAGKGRGLLYTALDPKTKSDLWVLPMEGAPKPALFLRTESNERDGAFSPDGSWIAYSSDESGRYEIFIQPYPATGAKWQVSRDGGDWPRWRGDGQELYWLEEDGTLVAVELGRGSTLQPGVPRALFETGIRGIRSTRGDRYAVARDGKRFLFSLPVELTVGPPVTVVQNWLARARM